MAADPEKAEATRTTTHPVPSSSASSVSSASSPVNDPAACTAHAFATDFPDGGRDAWLAVLGMWCTMFTTFGVQNAMGVFQDYYARVGLRDYSVSATSWILSVMVFTLSVTGVLFGYLADRFGPRPLIIGGTITCTAGLVALSFSRTYWQYFLSQSVLWALGAAAVCFAGMSAPATYFLRHRALAVGISMAGASVSGIVLPLMLRPLIDRIGFPWAVRALALLFLVLQVVAVFAVRYRPRAGGCGPAAAGPEGPTVGWRAYVSSVRGGPIVWTIVGFFLFWLGLLLPFNYAILQATDQGMSGTLALAVLPVMNALGVLGRIIPGLAADRLGRFNTTIAVCAAAAIGCFAVWIPGGSSVAAIVVFVAIFGFTSGAASSLEPVLVAQISDLSQLGTRNGAAFTIQAFGSLIGPPIGGAIVAAQGGSYVGLQVFCGLCMAGCAAAFWFARQAQAELRGKTWRV